jgi:hypothetical protein
VGSLGDDSVRTVGVACGGMGCKRLRRRREVKERSELVPGVAGFWLRQTSFLRPRQVGLARVGRTMPGGDGLAYFDRNRDSELSDAG